MIGEESILTLQFSYDNLEEYEIEEPSWQNITSTLLEEKEYQETNGTWQVIQHYSLVAYQTGKYTLTPLKLHLEMIAPEYQNRYNKNKFLQKIDLLSEPLLMNVLPLPQDLKIAGDYTLVSTVDTESIQAGEPVSFTLTLKGKGTVRNLDFLTLTIPNAMVYEQSSTLMEKTFSIVSDSNYTIPAVMLTYYHLKSKTVVFLSTQSYPITVIGKSNMNSNTSYRVLLFIIILLMILMIYALILLNSYTYLDEQKAFIDKLKQCRNKEALLKKIVPYMHEHKQLTRLVYKLESIDEEGFKGIKKEIIKSFLMYEKLF